ncbi:MAG: PAS domain S-box protein [Methanomicrobiales archaeon]|nr:PAS domain S-box protein [Methanomicrobiales archaeon]
MERTEEITSVILSSISGKDKRLSIVDLAERTGIHRNVLAKYIKVLEAQGKIEISRVGAKKFVQLSKRVSVSFLKVFTTLPFFIFDRYLTVIDKNDEIMELYENENINSELKDSQERLLSIFLTDEVSKLLTNALNGQRSHLIFKTSRTQKHHAYSLTIIPVVLDNGRPGSALLIEESTKEEQAKEDLEKISRAYQELLDNQVQFVVRFNRDYKIININSNFSDHTGIDKHLLIGSPFIPPYPEENFNEVIIRMSEISFDNPEITLDLRRINQNGDFSWERWKVRAVYDKKTRKFIEYFASGLDITELKRTEHEFLHLKNNLETIIQTRTIELREVNNELHKEIFRRSAIERELALTKFAIDSAHDFIFLLNSDGVIQYMNLRAREVVSKPDDALIHISNILISDSGTLVSQNIIPHELIDSGILTLKGLIHTGQGKDIPVEVTMSRTIEQDETVFCFIARDITDRNKIERDLYNYRKHLEQIIDERTKRLQHEIDERKILENSLSQVKNQLTLLTDTSREMILIYHKDKAEYFEANDLFHSFFSIKKGPINKSVKEKFQKISLGNINFQQFLEEKYQKLRKDTEEIFHETITIVPGKHVKVIIALKVVYLNDSRYIRICIIDITDLNPSTL